MKLNTVMAYWQTAVKQSFVAIQDPNTNEFIRTYFDDGEVQIRFIGKTVGDSIVYSKTELKTFERLHSIEDRSGEPVMADYFYQVKAVLPTLNALGFNDGYAYKVSRFTLDGTA